MGLRKDVTKLKKFIKNIMTYITYKGSVLYGIDTDGNTISGIFKDKEHIVFLDPDNDNKHSEIHIREFVKLKPNMMYFISADKNGFPVGSTTIHENMLKYTESEVTDLSYHDFTLNASLNEIQTYVYIKIKKFKEEMERHFNIKLWVPYEYNEDEQKKDKDKDQKDKDQKDKDKKDKDKKDKDKDKKDKDKDPNVNGDEPAGPDGDEPLEENVNGDGEQPTNPTDTEDASLDENSENKAKPIEEYKDAYQRMQTAYDEQSMANIVEEEESDGIIDSINSLKDIIITEENYEEIRDIIDLINNTGLRHTTMMGSDIKGIVDDVEDQLEDYVIAVGIGVGCGKNKGELKPRNFKYIKSIEEDKKVKDFINDLGRVIPKEKSNTNRTVKRDQDELLNIKKGNDINRVVVNELVNLEDPDLEYLFYSKMLEGSLMNYNLASNEELNSSKKKGMAKVKYRGPIICLVDTSSSMNYGYSESPRDKATTLISIISKELKKQNRYIYLVLFGSYGEIFEVAINKKMSHRDMDHIITNGFNGGTDFDTPILKAINILENSKDYELADILMISDGDCILSSNVKATLNRKRVELNFKFNSIVISSNKKDIDYCRSFSDKIINL